MRLQTDHTETAQARRTVSLNAARAIVAIPSVVEGASASLFTWVAIVLRNWACRCEEYSPTLMLPVLTYWVAVIAAPLVLLTRLAGNNRVAVPRVLAILAIPVVAGLVYTGLLIAVA